MLRIARLIPKTQLRSLHTSASLRDIVKVPQMAESITEGTLKQWNKKLGEFVNQDEEVATIETDKIDVSVNAPQSGKITELFASEEDTVEVGADLFNLEAGEAPAEESKPAPAQEPKSEAPKSEEKPKEEVQQASKPAPAPTPEPKKESKPAQSSQPQDQAPKTKGSRNETRVKMNRMRLRIAERLKQSQNTAASLTTFQDCDMSNLIEFRNRYKDRIMKETGTKLGFLSAFAKAACIALKEIPAANASIEGDEIVYRDYCDISIAVATPKGLVTPVIRNVESMNFVEIEQAIAEAGKKARDSQTVVSLVVTSVHQLSTFHNLQF
ncbi:CoA-dependent acyltransferase [Wallemia mellicola CBS 633.66]|uniref:Dihydrolipoamide acetyltransferase component of pyruvate dehydrogenase complex n=1 Tax=Wallemia mellicola (strain ATCC MYA-4683 / CBS 633.66) TaxID=671144 RepID=I4Y869_WALMC|nr:CoA-dependent acyltransferase [Wallemia mellicola CBS 633.66]EIM20161.1 CoA-dependent acyltransferase [Wallemia mellicola CBS 633.66]|eukprot:XP_006959882.1 CoA-dependent acyltransferase [Wallemia mellicola CBS 633.66]